MENLYGYNFNTLYGYIILLVCVCLLEVFPPPGVVGEAFSSTETLMRLAQKQEVLLTNVDKYIEEEEARLQELKMLVRRRRRYIESNRESSQRVLEEVHHPVTAYSLVRDWAFIADRVDDMAAAHKLKAKHMMIGTYLPDTNDRVGALRALIRLQAMYNLTADDMTTGNIRGHLSSTPLEGRDFYDLGVAALDTIKMVPIGLQWLKMAQQDPPVDVYKSDLLFSISKAYRQMSEAKKAREYLQKAYGLDLTNTTLQREYQKFMSDKDKYMETTRPSEQSWTASFEHLCRNNRSQEGSLGGAVWCEYQTSSISYVPHKLEVFKQDPWIVMYHDVLSNTETELMKNLSKSKLTRAKFSANPTDARVCKLDWLFDKDRSPLIQHLSDRVADVTRLDTSSRNGNAEAFQVVNYGLGGQYEPHLDYLGQKHVEEGPPHLKNSGDRVATFMFYLTDVPEGGATVFPRLDLYVPPVKNAAVFWYNMGRDGSRDQRTLHAGCPVLVGNKWVANKWIRERGQIFHHRCGQNPFTTEVETTANT